MNAQRGYTVYELLVLIAGLCGAGFLLFLMVSFIKLVLNTVW